MISAELQKAIDNLRIQDVYLRDFIARCQEDFDPKYNANFDALVVQMKYNVKQSSIGELENKQRFLRVFIELGIRWVDEKIKDESSSVKAFIEAEFIAEYAMLEMLEKASIDEFSLKNVNIHVWPYWRELLTNQCTRMHLPRVVLPTVQLQHNRLNEPAETGDATLSSKDV